MENEYLSHISNWWGDLHYSSLQKRGLAIIAGLVILITALFVFRGSSQEVVAAPAPLEIESISTQTLMVDVEGAWFESVELAGAGMLEARGVVVYGFLVFG